MNTVQIIALIHNKSSSEEQIANIEFFARTIYYEISSIEYQSAENLFDAERALDNPDERQKWKSIRDSEYSRNQTCVQLMESLNKFFNIVDTEQETSNELF